MTDDEARRYQRLVNELNKIGVRRDDVVFVPCAHGAREKLEAEQFDLLLLDVLLPLRPEEEPEEKHSLDLLVELHESDVYHRPGHIVGITADESVAQRLEPKFKELTWTLVHYRADNDDWIRGVVNCVKYLMAQSKDAGERPDYGTDLAIACALAEPELEQVLKLPWNWGAARPIDDLTFVHDGSLQVGSRTISVAAAAASRMGMVATALLSSKIINVLRPRLLVMCGICAGVKGKVNIGDVLLADPAWDFQSGKRVRDRDSASFSLAPHQLAVPSVVRSHIDQLRSDKSALSQMAISYGSRAPNNSKIVIGPVASGSAVIADAEVVKEIKGQHRDLVGVEMEIYGLYAAAHNAGNPQPKAFALKSVCDFADPDKGDDDQDYAAYASANALRLLMERFGDRLLD